MLCISLLIRFPNKLIKTCRNLWLRSGNWIGYYWMRGWSTRSLVRKFLSDAGPIASYSQFVVWKSMHMRYPFFKCAEEHNITLELDTGSVLGGVKCNGLLPWDLDGDLILLSSAVAIFGKKETVEHFQRNGLTLTQFSLAKRGYFKINFNSFYIEVWGMWDVTNTQYLPPELNKHATFTKANIRGKWIDTAFSPGLFARNWYGKEILKHSQSWIKVGLRHSFSDYVAGSFAPCKRPKHHSCLQLFPGDGSIPFLVT